MRQTGLVLIVLVIISLVSACNSDNTDKTMGTETPVESLEKDQVKKSINNDINMNSDEEYVGKFSYLRQLSLEKQEAFNRFRSERNSVLITVSIETTTHSLALGLQKEDQVWKLDIYPVIKDYINKSE